MMCIRPPQRGTGVRVRSLVVNGIAVDRCLGDGNGQQLSDMMTVIADWPHLPKQAEVQGKINEARDGYVTFALCTPTSILPAAIASALVGPASRP
jgi:hypothetical protein